MLKVINKVWLIDDDPIFTFIIKRLIELSDFCEEIELFDDGEIALKELANCHSPIKKPQIIFLDINMPMFDGWQFLDKFNKVPDVGEVIIFLVSSSIDPRDQKKAKEYAIVKELLVKPLSVEILKTIKKEYLSR